MPGAFTRSLGDGWSTAEARQNGRRQQDLNEQQQKKYGDEDRGQAGGSMRTVHGIFQRSGREGDDDRWNEASAAAGDRSVRAEQGETGHELVHRRLLCRIRLTRAP